MYELLIISGLGALTFHSFVIKKRKDEEESTPHKFGDRVGRLWDIVHQGMRENRLLKAEKALLAILKIDQKNAAAYNRLGILYAKQKEYKDAIDCFEIACSIEPTASSLHNLGLIFYETENYERSITAFDEALKLDPEMAARHIAIAKALEKVGNEKRMIDELEKAVELEPSNEAYELLEKAYRENGQPENADLVEDKIKKLIKPHAGNSRSRVKRPKRVII